MASQQQNPNYPPQPAQPSYGWAVPDPNQASPPPAYGGPPPPAYGAPPPQQYPAPNPAMYSNDNAATEEDFSDPSFGFSEKTIRMAFIRKVYGILMVQLSMTVGMIALFVYHPDVRMYSRQHPEMQIVAMIMTFVLLIALACCSDFRRRYPLNIILLGLFTLCEGFMLGSVASYYQSEDVLIAAGICTAVCLALMIFAFQTKYDFTTCGGILFVCVIVLLIFGIVAMFIPGKTVKMVYASLGALLFCCYLVFDTQMMMGGKHKYSISPEEYIFAALNLYLDIINIFLYILALVGGSRN